jgi:hypothetical protein
LASRFETHQAFLVARMDRIRSSCIFTERLAHPRRRVKPEFKQERYPPLDEPACCAIRLVSLLRGVETYESVRVRPSRRRSDE